MLSNLPRKEIIAFKSLELKMHPIFLYFYCNWWKFIFKVWTVTRKLRPNSSLDLHCQMKPLVALWKFCMKYSSKNFAICIVWWIIIILYVDPNDLKLISPEIKFASAGILVTSAACRLVRFCPFSVSFSSCPSWPQVRKSLVTLLRI